MYYQNVTSFSSFPYNVQFSGFKATGELNSLLFTTLNFLCLWISLILYLTPVRRSEVGEDGGKIDIRQGKEKRKEEKRCHYLEPIKNFSDNLLEIISGYKTIHTIKLCDKS